MGSSIWNLEFLKLSKNLLTGEAGGDVKANGTMEDIKSNVVSKATS